MIQTFTEKNKSFLKFYYVACKIGGIVLLAVGLAAVAGHSFALISRLGDRAEFNRYLSHDTPLGMIGTYIPSGLLVIGVSQLIRYLLEAEYQPGWILRNATRLLYLYTAMLVGYYFIVGTIEITARWSETGQVIYTVIAIFVVSAVKIFALVGVAQLIKRILPMIEDSRTIV